MALFTPEELEELRRADEELEADFRQTPEEIRESRQRDRQARRLQKRRKRMKLTLNVNEAARMLREGGIPMTAAKLSDGIERGFYPFGRLVSKDERSGRRSFEIFTVDVAAFIRKKTPEEVRT